MVSSLWARRLRLFAGSRSKLINSPVRAVARGREFFCEATRIQYTPYVPPGKGLAMPAMRPEGLSNTLGVLRTLPRMVRDAARVETPFLRVFGRLLRLLVKVQHARFEREDGTRNRAGAPAAQATYAQLTARR